MKSIRLSGHARENARFRGATEPEIAEAIETSAWARAELGRLECRKEYRFGREWNGRLYATKQVRPVCVEEDTEIVVVTVYVYCF